MTGPSSAVSEAVDGRARAILVISGRRLIAEALQELLRAQPGVEGCRAAWNIEDVHGCVRASPPSTFVIDLDEPGCGRSELIEVVNEHPETRRTGFYDAFTAPSAQMAFDLGITVLLSLAATLDQLVESVVADRRHSSATTAVGLTRQELARLNSLTPRELEVLNHIAQGRPVRAVAGLLGITVHTVETHKRRCFAKLGVQQQGHAVALAASAGMISST